MSLTGLIILEEDCKKVRGAGSDIVSRNNISILGSNIYAFSCLVTKITVASCRTCALQQQNTGSDIILRGQQTVNQ